jgi:hypothetical protein
MFTLFAASLILLGLSGVLIDWHRRSWRAARQNAELSDLQRRFARSQYHRRMQASGIIGVIGVAIGTEPLVPRAPWPMAFYLACLIGACACIMLLALLDVWATRQHFRRLHGQEVADEITRALTLRRTDKPPKTDP